MLNGILFSICTGLCWTCIGVVLSCCASRKLALVPYSFLQTFLTGAAAMLLIDFRQFSFSDLCIPAGLIFAAGCLNSAGQYTVHYAMKRGNHAPVWAISQSALILPFLTGILFFHNTGTAGQWIGTLLIVAGILTPSAKDFRCASGYLLIALAAFLIFGGTQVLYSLPAQLYDFRDAAGVRPFAAAWGGTAGWLLISGCTRTSLKFDRKTLLTAGVMVLVQLASLKLFFLSLDSLSAVNCGNIAFPLITGANISAFAAYSIFIRREKISLADKIGFGMVIAGLLSIAL